MNATIHATAVVDPAAHLADGVVIGPFCYVGGQVELGEGTELVAHATVLGPTRIGRRNRIYPYVTLGAAPQDRSYAEETSRLEIGDENVFREQVTIHRGTRKAACVTRVGSRCLFMVGAHVAHDANVADDVTLTNLATLGGHVQVDRGVVCAGHVAVAPFVRLGRSCFLAGGAKVESDVPPFVIAAGDRARVRALNLVGLRRAGVPEQSRRALKAAFRLIWRSELVLREALERTRIELAHDAYVAELLAFFR
jgi:UDP-N-acetylglucosamine acyltransferase